VKNKIIEYIQGVKMLNFFQRTRGSVTVFLIIILVPVIAICTIFVDASRIRLAGELAQSSANLALNTVLTQYDEELSDYYGLMASSQNVDEFYSTAQQYFVDCMVSQGMSVTLAQEFADDISDIISGKSTINDFIAIDQSDTSATIKAADNATLANPVMMKEEIVEFMKYRAPIKLVGDSLEDTTSFAGKLINSAEHIEVMADETRIEKEKNNYYTAESELMAKALEVYEALKKYESFLPADSGTFDKAYMEETVQGNMEILITDGYKELHRKYVSNWANTKDRTQFESVATKVASSLTSHSGDNESASSVSDAIKDCTTKREAFETARSNLSDTLSGITFASADQSKVNHIQYWVQMEDAISKDSDVYKKYTDALVDFLNAKDKMDVYYSNRETGTKTVETGEIDYDENNVPYNVKEEVDYDIKDENFDESTTIESAYNSESSSASSLASGYTSDSIYSISQYMEDYSKEALNTANENNVNRNDAKLKIEQTNAAVKSEYDDIVAAQKLLKTVIDLLPDVKTLVDKYNKTYETWKTDVESNTDKMENSTAISQDYYEIQTISQTGVEIPSEYQSSTSTNSSLVRIDISTSDLDAFSTKLQGIWDMLDSYRKAIETRQYRGVQIVGRKVTSNTYSSDKGIYDVDSLEAAAKGSGCSEPAVDTSKIPVLQSELDAYVEETWNATYDDSSITSITEGQTGNSPLLHQSDWKSDGNTASFDAWLHEKFPNDEPTLETTKGILQQFKNMLKQLKENALGQFGEYDNIYIDTVEINGKSSLPSAGTGADTGSLFEDDEDDDSDEALANTLDSSSGVGGLFDSFDFTDLLTDGRDNLYTVTYIMNMFSYDTSALEQIYKIQGGGSSTSNIYKMSDGNQISPKTASGYYDELLKEDKSATAKWWNTKTTFTQNKTLTNKLLDKENCISYGNEVEYILYGGTNEQNHSKVETTLFFTRYALNLAPVLSLYWNDEDLNAIANGIATVTQGVIPAPLSKMIIVLGVTAAESTVDRNYLMAGLPVIFYKYNPGHQLFVKIDLSDTDAFKKAIEEKNADYTKNVMQVNGVSISSTDITFSYSDYLGMYLFISLCTSPDNIYKRTADVIQTTMAQNSDGYLLSNAKTFFSLEATVRVKPMMMKLPYAQQSGIEVSDTETWNTFNINVSKGY
jgi:hypothetical protein